MVIIAPVLFRYIPHPPCQPRPYKGSILKLFIVRGWIALYPSGDAFEVKNTTNGDVFLLGRIIPCGDRIVLQKSVVMEDLNKDRKKMVKRQEVYQVVDGERDYQDELGMGPDGRTDGQPKSVGDYLTLLDVYLRKAQDAYAGRPGNVPSLHEVRKVAGIAVQCMEVHGAPERER